MSTNDLLRWLDDLVDAAAKEAHLPERTIRAFDGDSLVWIWREHPGDDRTAETRVSAKPDSLDEGLQFEVAAAAWLDDRRLVSWARTIWSLYLDSQNLDLDRMESLRNPVTRALTASRQSARDNALRLAEVNTRREQTAAELRERLRKSQGAGT